MKTSEKPRHSQRRGGGSVCLSCSLASTFLPKLLVCQAPEEEKPPDLIAQILVTLNLPLASYELKVLDIQVVQTPQFLSVIQESKMTLGGGKKSLKHCHKEIL